MNALAYEDMPLKINKATKKEKVKTMKKELSTNINELNSGYIVWYLVKKHKFFLSLTLNIIFVSLTIVHQAPIAWQNFIR